MSVVILARVTASNTNPSAAARARRNGRRSCTRCSKASRSSTSARAGCTRTAATSTSPARAVLALADRRAPEAPSCSSPRTRTGSISPTRHRSAQPITVHGLGRRRRRRDDHRARAPRRARLASSIWARDYVESRFKWKRRDPLWVLVLRVHRLAEPLTVAVERRVRRLHVVGRPTTGSPPTPRRCRRELVLSDVAFEAKRKGIREALPEECWNARLDRAAGVSRRGRGGDRAVRAVAAVAGLGERLRARSR